MSDERPWNEERSPAELRYEARQREREQRAAVEAERAREQAEREARRDQAQAAANAQRSAADGDPAARARRARPSRAELRSRRERLAVRPATPAAGSPPEASEPASGGAPPVARRGRSATGPRRVFAALLVVLAIAALWFLNALFQPFAGDGHGRVAITIPKGSGVGKIGDLLAARGVIAHGFLFELRTTLSGHRGDLKPGSYTLKHDMTYGAAIDALTHGPASNVVRITIPEGKSRREIQRLIAGDGLSGSYLKATVRSRIVNPRKLGGRHARDLEGLLFPATYELRRGSAVTRLVDKQLIAFKRTLQTLDLHAARKVNLTPYDVVTIASLVEREAQLPRERRLIASVIYNRLHEGIALGIDATTRFAVNNWSTPLTGAQLRSSSPYNTRNHRGLPPGPIGNPGLASLRAAARPAHTHFLYYVVKPGTCGQHAFSTTFAQFRRDSARYEAARRARGGRSPSRCGG